MDSQTMLWYKQPASNFNEALPVGNGRIGGMVYGGTDKEIIKLNEDSIWSGGKRERNNPDAIEGLDEVRKLLSEEKISEAEKIAFQKLQGVTPNSRHYMPLGDLQIKMKFSGKAKQYKRTLDLEQALCSVQFTANDITYVRDVFVSYPDHVMVIHIASDVPKSVNLQITLDGRDDYYDDCRPCEHQNTLLYTGGTGSQNGIFFASALSAKSEGGIVRTIGGSIIVEDADEATLILSVGTSFYNGNQFVESALLDNSFAFECSYEELLYRHLNDYQELFRRVHFSMPDNSDGGSLLPTDERLKRLHGDEGDHKECKLSIHDSQLAVLYFNYGRYLIISASRPGSQPMHLQGIWNEDMQPYLGSRYGLNVSTQMNYWPVEMCNLSECHMPLFDLLERIQESGRKTAKEMYGCRGFVCHHKTDIWGDSAPQDLWVPATIWPMGAAWLCLHIFEHYEYTQDVEFLAEKYGILRDAALFFADSLVENENGQLVVSPSVSPENTYITESGEKGSLCTGATMDTEIITVLFKDVIESSNILQKDVTFAKKLTRLLKHLPKLEVGKYGQIKEWVKDYEEAEVGHRHISHLFALCPSNLISPYKTPNLAKAARATLIRRLIHGSGHAGWSRAWIINMWERLFDGRMAYENLQQLLAWSTSPNMLNYFDSFQIDGNFGGTSAIAEFFMQSNCGEINLLPALPEEWAEGSISGLRAKGGFEVNIIWQDGRLVTASILSLCGKPCVLRCNTVASVTCNGGSVGAIMDGELIKFDTKEGELYTIRV